MKSLYTITAVGLVCACASTQPSSQLETARSEYQQARSDQMTQLALDDLYDAQKALEKAEEVHDRSPGSYKEQSLAYVAARKAKLAQANAGMLHAQQMASHAEQRLREEQQAMLSQTRSEASATRQQLERHREALRMTSAELQEQVQARQEAEERAQAALESLREVATVREESRGVVITLDGAVLFTTAQSELLPTAERRLGAVAETLKDYESDKRLRIEGHTDSRGTEEFNMELSRERAQSVADYLAENGIERSRMEIVGMGESKPIAPNDTPEGRANNRRVEITVLDASTTGERSPVSGSQGSSSGPGESDQGPSMGSEGIPAEPTPGPEQSPQMDEQSPQMDEQSPQVDEEEQYDTGQAPQP